MMVGTQRLDGSLPPVNSPKSYGITKPLSLAGPSSADVKRNVELEKVSFVCVSPENCSTVERIRCLRFLAFS